MFLGRQHGNMSAKEFNNKAKADNVIWTEYGGTDFAVAAPGVLRENGFCRQRATKTVPHKLASTVSHRSPVRLRDLCDEDKERISSLVRELAKLQEDKETLSMKLSEERQRFDSKIKDIEMEQREIKDERLQVEEQLKDYQQLIMQYQNTVIKQSRSHHHHHKKRVVQTDRAVSPPHSCQSTVGTQYSPPKAAQPTGPTFRPLTPDSSECLSTPNSARISHHGSIVPTVQLASDRHQEFFIHQQRQQELLQKGKQTRRVDQQRHLETLELQRQQAIQQERQQLLEEQKRLQLLLKHQEDLLIKKQHELEEQYREQDERLRHFKRTGSFPVEQKREQTNIHKFPTAYSKIVPSPRHLAPRKCKEQQLESIQIQDIHHKPSLDEKQLPFKEPAKGHQEPIQNIPKPVHIIQDDLVSLIEDVEKQQLLLEVSKTNHSFSSFGLLPVDDHNKSQLDEDEEEKSVLEEVFFI